MKIELKCPCKNDGTRTAIIFMRAFYIMIVVPEDIKKKIDERYAIAPYSSIDKFLRENSDVDAFLFIILYNISYTGFLFKKQQKEKMKWIRM